MGQTITRRLKPRSFSQDFTEAKWAAAGLPAAGPSPSAYASLVVNTAGDRNAFKLFAQAVGTDGNSTTFAMIDPSANDEPLAVDVTGADIVVTLGTGPSGDIISSARQICQAIAANEDAVALVRTEFVDDSGDSSNSDEPVAALSEAPLAGGLDFDAHFAWASLGTLRPGSIPQSWSVQTKEAFALAAVGDANLIRLFAYQAAGVSAARWFPALFAALEPQSGGPVSAVRTIGGRVDGWLGSGGVSADSDFFVATNTTMKATAYTLANTVSPGQPRNVSITHVKAGAASDTLGSAQITGIDEDGAALVETIALVAESTVVSLRKFLSVSEIITADWVTDGTADKIEAGYAADGVDPVLDTEIVAILESDDDVDLADLIDPLADPVVAGDAIFKVNAV